MITTLLLALGLPALGSAIVAAVMGPGPAVALAGRAGKGVWGFLKSLTPRSWLVIGGVVLLVAGVIWHQRHAAAELQDAYDRGVAAERRASTAERERLRREAAALRGELEQQSASATAQLRERTDEQNRSIAAGADRQRVHGPGKAAAACPGPGSSAGVPGGASGRLPTVGSADAAAVRLLASDWHATVPWQWLVDRAEQCDLNRAEALTWRDWHRQQSTIWEQYRAQLGARAADSKGD